MQAAASEPDARATGAAPRADPCAVVIFGAMGDLARRLLVPALYHLARDRLLPEAFALIGVARAGRSDDDFRRHVGEALRDHAEGPVEPASVGWLLERTSYVQGDFDDAGTYVRLRDALAKQERTRGIPGNCLFYLAIPPALFAVVPRHLAESGLARERDSAWRRVVVEKPFGTDLPSAQRLNRELHQSLAEHQIFRIDHYLGKETVQNIMVLRFGNGLFEPIWNREHVAHVQISVAETVTVEQRGGYYDATGALRDMVPNHLFQLLTLIAMEPPTCFAADAVRTEKEKVLESVRPLTAATVMRNVVRAQYDAGDIDGRHVPRYRDEPDVHRDSETETYVAMRLEIENWRWAGVPFYLRTGKSLGARDTEIAIRFKRAPFAMFREVATDRLAPNYLVLRIQPDEGIALAFNAKVPGTVFRIGGVHMDMSYREAFDATPGTGYETLLYDCMTGDATLFQRAANIEAAWRIVQPILDTWRDAPRPVALPTYRAGSSGPAEADALIERDGDEWRALG